MVGVELTGIGDDGNALTWQNFFFFGERILDARKRTTASTKAHGNCGSERRAEKATAYSPFTTPDHEPPFDFLVSYFAVAPDAAKVPAMSASNTLARSRKFGG
ncbi:MAG: hypothetical protein ACTSRM_11225, partial [Alphaproteobacteria bacterium]